MSNSTSESKRLTVGFPLYDDVTLLDFAGATQVFAFAGGFIPCLVKKTREHQAKQFLVPIEAATDKVLAGWNTQTLHL
jgi:hypothetical protein